MRPSNDWGPAADKDRRRAGYPVLEMHMTDYTSKSSLALTPYSYPDDRDNSRDVIIHPVTSM